MFGKISITCKMVLKTGMHIGGSSGFSAIGTVDSPVVRDTASGDPMVPGSSLKGKMRSLLAQAYSPIDKFTLKIEEEPEALSRLFGTPSDKKGMPRAARLQFTDAFISNKKEMQRFGDTTEVKFENTINRITAIANPRQIERVVRNSEFKINLMYDMVEAKDVEEDFETIAHGLKLLCMDYLGGHGSRGYGRVAFSEFAVRVLDGQCPISEEKLCEKLKEVEAYDIYAV